MRVLIVEDQVLAGFALAHVLVDEGHHVIGPALTTGDAIRLARTERPELAFVDIDLEVNGIGLELARYLDQDCQCPVILTTGRPELARSCEWAIGLLAKPYDLDAAALAVDASPWLVRGETPPADKMPVSLEILRHASRRRENLKPVLLVEDHPHDVELTIAALKKCAVPNPVVVARDGVEAVEYLESHLHGESPAVVLLDIKMPRMSGIDVLRRLKSRAELSRVPIVILTASNQESDMQTCHELGANDYIVKPRGFDGFAKELKKLSSYLSQRT